MNTTIKRTQDELTAEMTARFGPDHKQWAFICPSCKDTATAQDFKDVLTANGSDDNPFQHLGQICIGRLLGVLKREQPKGGYTGRGCDWTAFGLFRGPEFVIMPDGHEVASFPIAPAPESAA